MTRQLGRRTEEPILSLYRHRSNILIIYEDKRPVLQKPIADRRLP
jgi:hypothetical protein